MSQSEVHAYVYINKELTEKKGWDRNQIYVQQECHKHPEIRKYLGQTKPEDTVDIDGKYFYVIESKNERKKLDAALKEAREDYADKINQSDKIQVLFVTGIAGNDEEGFISKSQYRKNGKWIDVTENGIEVTGLLSKNQIEQIMEKNDPDLRDIEISEDEFLKSAEEINGILHANAINKDTRARLMAALLLALYEGTDINLNEKPVILIESINSRVDLVLRKHNKEDFARFIKIERPSSPDNHIKLKKAIVLTIQELLGLSIRSAMKSGKDIIGRFYESFLKYGNGAKEIGIVLTPRHITRFCAESMNITPNDLVLDPACGTGGFLVAAYDEVRKNFSQEELDRFRLYGLYGIEQQDHIVALALVNMIFRGDGKNNIIEGNCFKKWLNVSKKGAEFCDDNIRNRVAPITKVMMNPPFAQDKSDEPEFKFVEHALEQMTDEGILFSVLPTSVTVKGGQEHQFRKRLLMKNTLLCVITFPDDLFYPTNVNAIGLFVKKGVPHPKNQNVLWIKLWGDGFLKKKRKRLFNPKARNDIPKVQETVKNFLKNQNIKVTNIPKLQNATPIDFSDEELELIPEAYLDEANPSTEVLKEEIEQLIRENLAFKIKFEKQLKEIK